ncbi:MAG: hypothetical protein AB7T38_09995 [Nitrospirales bacterium]
MKLPPPQLHERFASEPNAHDIVQKKLSFNAHDRLPLGVFMVLQRGSFPSSQVLTENAWPLYPEWSMKALDHSMKEAVKPCP